MRRCLPENWNQKVQLTQYTNQIKNQIIQTKRENKLRSTAASCRDAPRVANNLSINNKNKTRQWEKKTTKNQA